MRLSNEIVALVAATSFAAVSAAPVPAPEAEAAPHNFFRNRYGGGYASPHFVHVGTWKRDAPAAAPVKRDAVPIKKRDELAYDIDGRGDRCKLSLY